MDDWEDGWTADWVESGCLGGLVRGVAGWEGGRTNTFLGSWGRWEPPRVASQCSEAESAPPGCALTFMLTSSLHPSLCRAHPPSSREGTLQQSHHAVPGAPQGQHIPEPVWERGHETDTRRYTSRVGLAHQVIATGDGQGERGVAAPQRAGVGSVGQQEPDDVPGALGRREAGRRVTGARPLQGKLTQHAVSPATDCSSLVLGPCLAHHVP